MGIKEMDACASSVSGAEKQLDVAVWFAALASLCCCFGVQKNVTFI